LDDISCRRYFVNAVYQWCVDKGQTPHLVACWRPDKYPDVPADLAANNRIVFNLSPEATRNLKINDDGVFFTARFLGRTAQVDIALADVVAIYGKEAGKGISFPPVEGLADEEQSAAKSGENAAKAGQKPATAKKRPNLRVV
jgi:stringent starvation protein B